MEWAKFVPEYLLPFFAVLGVGFAVIKTLRDQNSNTAAAVIEVTPEILEGVRDDLRLAIQRAEEARESADGSRKRAEAAEAVRDAERAARRKVEDEFYAYRVDARAWTSLLLRQLDAAGVTPIEAPDGFKI